MISIRSKMRLKSFSMLESHDHDKNDIDIELAFPNVELGYGFLWKDIVNID
jgi:hypothetical protein